MFLGNGFKIYPVGKHQTKTGLENSVCVLQQREIRGYFPNNKLDINIFLEFKSNLYNSTSKNSGIFSLIINSTFMYS